MLYNFWGVILPPIYSHITDNESSTWFRIRTFTGVSSIRVPTPHAEEALSVHLRVLRMAPGGCVALDQGPT